MKRTETALLTASAVALAAVLLLRLWLVWSSTPRELAALTPDDAYYYFGIARNIASMHGSTFDGVNPTNGYHPLWMIVCASNAFAFGLHNTAPELLPRIMLSYQLFFGALGVALLFIALQCRLKRPSAALILAAAALPWPIYAMTDGLESGLNLLFFGAGFLLVQRWQVFTVRASAHDFAFGAFLAIGLMSRLDNALLMVALACYAILAWRRGSITDEAGDRLSFAEFAAKAALWAAPVLATFALYLFLNSQHFDSATPISGKLKNTFPTIAFSTKWLLMYPACFAAGILAVVAPWMLPRSDWPVIPWLRVCSIFILLHMMHTILFMDWAVHVWHFTAYWFPAIASAALVLDRVQERFGTWTGLATGAGVILIAAAGQYRFLHGRTDRAFQARSYDAATSGISPGPPDARFAMSDCGVFGYYRERSVVNLDGVVNNMEFQRALEEDRLMIYLLKKQVSAIAHHAVDASRVQPGYSRYEYVVRGHLDNTRRPITLFENYEIYRSEEYNDGTGPKFFIVWSYVPPFTRP